MFASGKGGLEAKHALDLEVVAPEIRVKCEGPSKRFLQRKALHQFTIENRGTAKATNVGLVARLPSGLRYVSADKRLSPSALANRILNSKPRRTLNCSPLPITNW